MTWIELGPGEVTISKLSCLICADSGDDSTEPAMENVRGQQTNRIRRASAYTTRGN